jgi:predicted ABC-type transport system involved in lysophospholipase L1 biosynthesis ATPase subunit
MSTADLSGVALGYEPPVEQARREGRIWIAAGGSHVLRALGAGFKSALLAAVLDLKPRGDAQVVILGAELRALDARARETVRAQVAFLPADGGLISHLNGWENIALPVGFHAPRQLRDAAPRVYAVLEPFVADTRTLLGKLPEEMTPYERALTGYARMRLSRPRLVLAENPPRGLGAAERQRADGFAAAYLADCPEGTFVRLEDGAQGTDEAD